MSDPAKVKPATPYRPPWYPEHLPAPFVMTGDSGPAAKTHYEAWCDTLEPGELQRLIREYRERQEA